jgi:two-component system, NarL family, sensor kinase
LENGGLAGTVQAFAAGFARRTGVQTSVRMPEATDNLSFEIQRSLLRVIQEALTNTHRHAAASRVVIDLRFGAETLKLRVLDDAGWPMASVRRLRADHCSEWGSPVCRLACCDSAAA